jgi:hypothetical protein
MLIGDCLPGPDTGALLAAILQASRRRSWRCSRSATNAAERDPECRKIRSAAGYYDDYQAGQDPAVISIQEPALAAHLVRRSRHVDDASDADQNQAYRFSRCMYTLSRDLRGNAQHLRALARWACEFVSAGGRPTWTVSSRKGAIRRDRPSSRYERPNSRACVVELASRRSSSRLSH